MQYSICKRNYAIAKYKLQILIIFIDNINPKIVFIRTLRMSRLLLSLIILLNLGFNINIYSKTAMFKDSDTTGEETNDKEKETEEELENKKNS